MTDAPTTNDRDAVITRAEIAENVVKYHLLSTAVLMTCLVVTIPFMLIVLPIQWFFTNLHYKHLSCELTESAVKVDKGVLNRVEKTIPLEKITDVAFFQGPVMRYMNIDGIRFETAGQSGVGALVNIMGMKNCRAFRDAVLEQKDEVIGRKKRSAPAPDVSVAPAEPGVPTSGAGLDEIRDILLRIEQKLSE